MRARVPAFLSLVTAYSVAMKSLDVAVFDLVFMDFLACAETNLY